MLPQKSNALEDPNDPSSLQAQKELSAGPFGSAQTALPMDNEGSHQHHDQQRNHNNHHN